MGRGSALLLAARMRVGALLAARLRAGALLAAAALAGCGSEDDPRAFPPAAEPARSPVPAERPAGTVVRVGNKPEGLVADASTGLVAVALTKPDGLALVDHRTGDVVRRVRLPGSPRHLRLAEGTVLVPAESADVLVRVPLGERGQTPPQGQTPPSPQPDDGGQTPPSRPDGPTIVPVGDGPHDADASAGRAFVADEFGSTLSIVEEGRTVERVRTPLQPGGVAAVPGGPVALVAVRERVLALYDRSGREIARRPAGVGPTHVEAGDGGRVYVADTAGDAILLFRTRPQLELVRRVALPGSPYGMTIDRERGRLWVTLTARNEVVWLPANGAPRPVDRYPTVRQPNSVAVHEPTGRVFVASRADGTLQLFDPRR